MIQSHGEKIASYRERAARLKRDIKRYLDELRHDDPVKYQELLDAEQAMYNSFLEERHNPVHPTTGGPL